MLIVLLPSWCEGRGTALLSKIELLCSQDAESNSGNVAAPADLKVSGSIPVTRVTGSLTNLVVEAMKAEITVTGKFHQRDSTNASNPLVIDRLYGILSVLDAKATGLLTVNSLIMAGLAAMLVWMLSPSATPEVRTSWWDWWFIVAATLLVAISSLYCMCVVRISWEFLKHADVEAKKFDSEFTALANKIFDRTSRYSIAWLLTLCAMVVTPLWIGSFVWNKLW